VTADILAAGGIVWRTQPDGAVAVGLVRRTRYGGDIGLPKGKLEKGERLRDCAVREVAEELGVDVQLGDLAGTLAYPVAARDKYVLVWEMRWLRDLPQPPDGGEIAERLWLPPLRALTRLTYAVERRLLAEVISRHDPR